MATFPTTFWLLSLVCLAYYVAIFPFISLGQVFFMKKFDFEAQNANFITGSDTHIDRAQIINDVIEPNLKLQTTKYE